ncbi:TauD/TfdA family dioxygenase [Candidatus Methylopumilus planktonicus]|uniref:TauD/TfdA family dioxygenase n=1 Tax=Candidatus Methylopumilus planktonicus TaxID=1581557 RepID=UPI003D18F82D
MSDLDIGDLISQFDGIKEYKIVPYGKDGYVKFDSIYYENELHFDGISADNIRIVPDYLIFFVTKSHSDQEGKFRLLNTPQLIDTLNEDLKGLLSAINIDYYGFKHISDSNPSILKKSFSLKPLQKYKGNNVLRLHIPSLDQNQVSYNEDYLHCHIDNFRIRVTGMSGKELYMMFMELNNYIEKSNAILNFTLKNSMVYTVNNNYVFHGRYGVLKPTSREMYRIQLYK